MPEDNNGQTAPSSTEISDSEWMAAISPPDLKGRINLRIDQALQAEIERIAEDSRYPLNSASEVVRFCCLLGLERIRQWDHPAPTLLGQIKAASAIVLRDKIQCDATQLLDRMDERIAWYIEHHEYDQIIDLVAKVRSYFEESKDFWADHIKQNIDARFILWMETIDALRKEEK